MAHQIWFWAKSCSGRFVSPVSLALRMRSSQRARRRCRSSRSASWPRAVLVANAVTRMPVEVGDAQLRAGVRSFLAHDHPHPRRPGREVEQAGDVGDPRAVTDCAVAVVGRRPRLLRHLRQRRAEGVGQGEPDRVRQPLRDQPVQELVRAPGAVGADQHLPPGPGPAPVTGQLRQRGLDHGDVVGGGVRTGVALRSRNDSGSPVPVGAVVDERPQRMEPEPAFERRRRLLLVRVRGNQRGVDVDDQRPVGVDAVIGGVLAGQRPHRARAAARAASIAANARAASAASASIVRDTVGSDATSPNTAGSARSSATSARQSPPRASVTARSVTTLPGSWIAIGLRHRASAVDNARSSPAARTVSTSATPPACDTTPTPPRVGMDTRIQPDTLHLEGAPRSTGSSGLDNPDPCWPGALFS